MARIITTNSGRTDIFVHVPIATAWEYYPGRLCEWLRAPALPEVRSVYETGPREYTLVLRMAYTTALSVGRQIDEIVQRVDDLDKAVGDYKRIMKNSSSYRALLKGDL